MSMEHMTLEELFVRGCYFYAIGNSIWYIYRAKLSRTAEDIKLEATMNEALTDYERAVA